MILHRSRETRAGCQQGMAIDLVNSERKKRWLCQCETLGGRVGPSHRLTWKIKLMQNECQLPSSRGPVHLSLFFFDLSFAPLLLHQVPMTIIPECPLDSWEMHNSLNCPRKHNPCLSSQRNRTTVQFSNLSWKIYTYNLCDWFLGKVGTISITWGRSKYHNYLIRNKQISILLWKSAFCVRLLS